MQQKNKWPPAKRVNQAAAIATKSALQYVNNSEINHKKDADAKAVSDGTRTYNLQPGILGEVLECLLHSQICHNLLAPTINCRILGEILQALNTSTHACARDTPPSQDLHRVV